MVNNLNVSPLYRDDELTNRKLMNKWIEIIYIMIKVVIYIYIIFFIYFLFIKEYIVKLCISK